jgi:glycosyltransferase involved in cell wall biosynthesis
MWRGRPLLTIVVPAHNVAPFLPDCLDSILTGAADQLQVVAVDDASPDDAGQILDDYAGHDGRVMVLHLRDNVGLGPARNAAFDRARGEYLWFVDGDDRLPLGGVAAVTTRLVELRPDVLLVDHLRLHPDGRLDADPHETPVGQLPGTLRLANLPRLLGVRQAAWNRIVRRELLDSEGLRFPGGWYEDVGFSHLALLCARRIGALGRVGYHYRYRPDGAITTTRSARHFEVFAQYERLFARLDRRPVEPELRARLFEVMIEHYLVIVGTETRIPTSLRPAFFTRMVEHYRRYLPSPDYSPPGGWNGVKHRFVRWDAYPAFIAARNVYRAGRRWVPASRSTLFASRRQ